MRLKFRIYSKRRIVYVDKNIKKNMFVVKGKKKIEKRNLDKINFEVKNFQ